MSDPVQDAYEHVTVELPNGRTLQAKTLPYQKGIVYLRKLVGFADGKTPSEDMLKVLEEFPPLVGIDVKELEGLTLGEMYDLVMRFLFLRRTTKGNGKNHDPVPPTG